MRLLDGSHQQHPRTHRSGRARAEREHAGRSPWDSPVFEHYTRTADAAGVELLVRLPGSDPDLIRKVLDTGVRNGIIPRVEMLRDVRRAMEATRFVFDGGPGKRGFATERPAGYGVDTEGYIDREDRSVFAGVLIEKREAIEHLDEILDVPELGSSSSVTAIFPFS